MWNTPFSNITLGNGVIFIKLLLIAGRVFRYHTMQSLMRAEVFVEVHAPLCEIMGRSPFLAPEIADPCDFLNFRLILSDFSPESVGILQRPGQLEREVMHACEV